MLKKVNALLDIPYNRLDWKTVLFILFLVALIIRFPFFFRDYVDRDESTFIIMAQSWVDGHLPYTRLWDLKPPITFLTFAGIISIFGKSFIAIRLAGTLFVALTALFTYTISLTITSKKVAFWASVFCVFFLSLFGSLQGVMSEHICTLFFISGLYVVLSRDQKYWFLIAGLLFGLSVMSKLNMAYPLLSLGVFLLSKYILQKDTWQGIQRLTLMGLGFLLLVGLTAVPYLLNNLLETWFGSIFEAPLAYSKTKFHSVFKALPMVLVTALLILAGLRTKLIDGNSKTVQALIAVIAGVLLSFIQTGKVNGHYLIQLYPFFLILAAVAAGKLPRIGQKYSFAMAILILLVPMESYLEYANVISNKIKKGSFYNGEGVDIPNYITENKLNTENIFFTEYHIGYWLLGEEPPTKAATHPSNITREKLFPFMDNPRKTGLEELRYIMEQIQPEVVVARKKKTIFDKKLVDFNQYIDAYLAEHYRLIKSIDRGLIYQRLK
ncbi:ArnT family glycosyltransferase [Flagellimonas flava]|uniref:Dolichyl-phosphate-mannose-protein mannosyltransferase n=1 Tax=Flagellimonas flava TaxID=570519 RepID=A0A1M5KHS1_9FLAO|nr:glycosyltransferase family 39 protein [Allomuricauda flava]SHG52434.1 Dolichyl-phosphate-mannose-protein mannosyltransferase [Allomuricauda flava]